jgi:cytidine deaminase
MDAFRCARRRRWSCLVMSTLACGRGEHRNSGTPERHALRRAASQRAGRGCVNVARRRFACVGYAVAASPPVPATTWSIGSSPLVQGGRIVTAVNAYHFTGGPAPNSFSSARRLPCPIGHRRRAGDHLRTVSSTDLLPDSCLWADHQLNAEVTAPLTMSRHRHPTTGRTLPDAAPECWKEPYEQGRGGPDSGGGVAEVIRGECPASAPWCGGSSAASASAPCRRSSSPPPARPGWSPRMRRWGAAPRQNVYRVESGTA